MIAMKETMREGYAKAYTRAWVVDIIQMMDDPLIDGKSAYVHERNPVWADGGVSYSPRDLWGGNRRGVLCARYLQRGENPIFRMINNHANWQPRYGANSLSKFSDNHCRLE